MLDIDANSLYIVYEVIFKPNKLNQGLYAFCNLLASLQCSILLHVHFQRMIHLMHCFVLQQVVYNLLLLQVLVYSHNNTVEYIKYKYTFIDTSIETIVRVQ